MFQVLLAAFVNTIVPVIAYLKFKDKISVGKHVMVALVSGVLTLLLTIATQAEIAVRTALGGVIGVPILPELVFTFLIPAGITGLLMGILYLILAFMSAMGMYVVGYAIGALFEWVGGVIR